MPTPRRVGAETSATRAALLDGAERLLVQRGYAAITYRNVAGAAGVTSGLVQYYFPKLDALFVAMLERRGKETLERLEAALAARPDDVLQVIWESSTDDAAAAMTVEFMALANHRKAIAAHILEVTQQTRTAQLRALEAQWEALDLDQTGLTPAGLLFLLHAIPKMALLEESIGLQAGHEEVLALVERRLRAR